MLHVKGEMVPSSMGSNMPKGHVSGVKINRSTSASRAVSEECAVVSPQADCYTCKISS